MLRRLVVFVVVLLTAAPALAHEVGLSRGSYQLAEGVLHSELVFQRAELVTACDVETDEEAAACVLSGMRVTSGDAVCEGETIEQGPFEGDALRIVLEHRCPAEGSTKLELTLLDDLPFAHRHLATAGGAEQLLHGPTRTVELSPGAAAQEPMDTTFVGMLVLGIEHILLGYDHLVFLLGLVLVGKRWRELALVITAFTLAHSITLGLVVLGVLAPAPRFIEPAIALSIAYVGVENFFIDDASKRWRITLPFGLIHGFGFAGALGEVSVPTAQVPMVLLGFNLGVEIGQFAVMALLLPLVLALRKRKPVISRRAVQVISVAIVLAGVTWFVERVIA